MVQWTEQFTTGSKTLDHQHQTLIDHVNRLEMMLAIGQPTRDDYEAMMKAVDFLEFYADAHFKAEEECMEAFRCPAHAANKEAHAQFIQFFDGFKAHNKAKGFPREIVVELHTIASEWITGHILKVDTQLRRCIKG